MITNCNLQSILNCSNAAPAVQKITIFEFGDIYDIEYDITLGSITDYKFRKLGITIQTNNLSSFSESLVRSNNLIWEQTLYTSISKLEYTKLNEVFKLSKKKFTIIFEDSNGLSWLLGYEYPSILSENTNQTGDATGSNHIELTFTSNNNRPVQQIKSYNPDCAASFQSTVLISSRFVLSYSYILAGSLLELQNSTSTNSLITTYEMRPEDWNTNPIQYQQDFLTLSSLLVNSNSYISELSFDSDNWETYMTIVSTDNSYPILSVDSAQSFAVLSTTLRVQTTVSNPNLPNLQIELSDSTGVVFDLPLGTTIPVQYITGTPEDFYIDITSLYSNQNESFIIRVGSSSTICSTLVFDYIYQSYNNCSLLSSYNLYNSYEYSIKVDKFTTESTYRKLKINIDGFVRYIQLSESEWTSDFNTLVANLSNVLDDNLNILSYTIVELPKSWILTFTYAQNNISPFIISYSDDSANITNTELNNYTIYTPINKTALNLNINSLSNSNLTVTNTASYITYQGIQSQLPTYIDSRLQLIDLQNFQSNTSTGNLTFNISDWEESDIIEVTAVNQDCPTSNINFKIDTCLDAAIPVQNSRIIDIILLPTASGSINLGNQLIYTKEGDHNIYTYTFPYSINYNNFSLLSDYLANNDMKILDWSYDGLTNSYYIRIICTDSNNTSLDYLTLSSASYSVSNYITRTKTNLISKQHPDIDLRYDYTDLINSNVITTGKVDDYNISYDNLSAGLPYTTVDSNSDDTVTITMHNASGNNSEIRTLNIYEYTGTNMNLLYSASIPSGSVYTINNISSLFNPAQATHIQLSTDTTANTYKLLSGNLATTTQSFAFGSHSIIASEGFLDNYSVYQITTSKSPVILTRYSLNCPNQDIDALNYIYLSQSSDDTINSALTVLTSTIKSIGIWDKLDIIYPFVGDTVDNSLYNLKDINKFKGVPYGSWALSQTDIWGTSNNSYIDTGYNLYSNVSQNSIFQLLRIRGNSYNLGGTDFGVINSVTGNGTYLSLRSTNANSLTTRLNSSINNTVAMPSSIIGIYYLNRTNASNYTYGYNSTTQTVTASSVPLNSANLYIGAVNSYNQSTGVSTPLNSSRRAISLYIAGESLTPSEITALINAINNYNTNTNR